MGVDKRNAPRIPIHDRLQKLGNRLCLGLVRKGIERPIGGAI